MAIYMYSDFSDGKLRCSIVMLISQRVTNDMEVHMYITIRNSIMGSYKINIWCLCMSYMHMVDLFTGKEYLPHVIMTIPQCGLLWFTGDFMVFQWDLWWFNGL